MSRGDGCLLRGCFRLTSRRGLSRIRVSGRPLVLDDRA
jgi:hypothetical protein